MKAQFFPYADERISKKTPYFTYGLIVANVIAFIISLFSFEYVITTFGFIPANPDIVSMFTHMFLHGGILHLFVNMWYLYIFGDNMEVAFGGAKFIAFYIISGLFALTFHYITNPLSAIPVVGASGAVSGVLGAYLGTAPSHEDKGRRVLHAMEASHLCDNRQLVHTPAFICVIWTVFW